jgi:hypothetical protein
MEQMLEAVARLQAEGYRWELTALPAGRLRCGGCSTSVEGTSLTVDATVRFEGDSNPDDEAILVALTMPCGHQGLFSAAFGPTTPPDDVDVLHALITH